MSNESGRRRTLAAAAGVLGVATALVLIGAGPAQAITFGTFPPGSTVCTDRVRSDTGVSFYGYVATPGNQPVTWSLRAGATATGPDAEVLRRVTVEATTTNYAATGRQFYRLCVIQTASVAAQGVRASLIAFPDGNALYGTGPHTAVLGPDGSFCGEFLSNAAGRYVGTSDVPVRWQLQVENGDGDHLRTEELGTSATIDRVVVPGVNENFIACVTNTAASTATLSVEIS